MLSNTEYIHSPNKDLRPIDITIDSIVIHCISLPPGEFDDFHIKQLFTNNLNTKNHPYFALLKDTKVSSHLLISRNGKITQFVPFDERAWHAGKSEYNDRKNYNDFSIGIELVGSDNSEFTAEQYVTLRNIVQELKKMYPIKNDNILAHSDIAPNRKTDPGICFNWQYFFELINNEVTI